MDLGLPATKSFRLDKINFVIRTNPFSLRYVKAHSCSADASSDGLGAVLIPACWACKKFNDNILGSKFLLETDHKPLVPLLSGLETIFMGKQSTLDDCR